MMIIRKFLQGLSPDIRSRLEAVEFHRLDDLVERVVIVEKAISAERASSTIPHHLDVHMFHSSVSHLHLCREDDEVEFFGEVPVVSNVPPIVPVNPPLPLPHGMRQASAGRAYTLELPGPSGPPKGIEFLQTLGMTPASGSPLEDASGPRYESLKEKLDEHSKQLEQSAEKLSKLESENLTLQDENQALNTASNKKRRFRAQIRPMPTLETPNSGTGTTLPPKTSHGDAATREKTKGSQTYDVEDSESEPNPNKEAPREQ
ncbi:hypothetical protein DY000_02015895 [Brassica cretica]|uniref:Uncharacterized protein n=1 Tax=Brassica cretica TaxID=69181 RepID=A0ABQ7DA61_BRACR|nr:hypothetical protein DY000_02015895 [Brassica cretica]